MVRTASATPMGSWSRPADGPELDALRSPYDRQAPAGTLDGGCRRWMARGSGWRCRIKDPQHHATGSQIAGMLCRSLKKRRNVAPERLH
jgi:hypothetical protein